MKFFCFFLLLITPTLVSSRLSSRPLNVEISAPSALLMNADTGVILYEKEAHKRCYPASPTKIATALYVLEKKGEKLFEKIEASKTALTMVTTLDEVPYHLTAAGSSAGIKQGEVLSLNTLLHGLLLVSGNDAANVLAEAVSGSITKFMHELNFFLRKNGIQETSFVNPHGLHHPNHWTTAYDLALMTKKALKNPFFCKVVKTTQFVRPQTNKNLPGRFVQTNRLLKSGPYFYPQAIGVKTGYTSQSGYSLVGAATHEGRTLIAVLLGSPQSGCRFRDAIKLFEAAFSEKLVSRVLFSSKEDRFSHTFPWGTKGLEAFLSEDLIVKYYPSEELSLEAQIKWEERAPPVKKNDIVGYLKLIDENKKIIKELPLFSLSDVGATNWFWIKAAARQHKGSIIGAILIFQIVLLLFYFLRKNYRFEKGSK